MQLQLPALLPIDVSAPAFPNERRHRAAELKGG